MEENKKLKIITHSGKFHADEVFATAVLEILLGKDKVEIIRSRDNSVIDSGDYVVDVGGVYDPKTNRFDHHQEERAGN